MKNPNKSKSEFEIPKNNWNVVVNDQKAGLEIITTFEKNIVEVKPISAMVMYR